MVLQLTEVRVSTQAGLSHVVVQLYPWFKFFLFVFWYISDNELRTKANKIYTKDEIEPVTTTSGFGLALSGNVRTYFFP